MPSTLWRIMEESQKLLQSMEFMPEQQDACPAINQESIIICKPRFAMKEEEASLPQIPTPGLVITPPLQVTANPDAGTNLRDDVNYPVLIQLVDTDSRDRSENLSTYLRWLEQIRRAFNARGWPEVEIALYGDVYQSFAQMTSTIDTKLWQKQDKFVAGVIVTFTVREQRGV